LEIGVGFNTPSVLRWPMESLTYTYSSQVNLIRINLEHAEVPEEIKQNFISLCNDATIHINNIHTQ
jgi:hypothetical protein